MINTFFTVFNLC